MDLSFETTLGLQLDRVRQSLMRFYSRALPIESTPARVPRRYVNRTPIVDPTLPEAERQRVYRERHRERMRTLRAAHRLRCKAYNDKRREAAGRGGQ